jgi:hypothetical protein
MPTFCRHNRFIERCPICSKTLPGNEASVSGRRSAVRAATRSQPARGSHRPRAAGLRVRREGRAAEDGYHNELVPGLRASADAQRLAGEIEFAAGRLATLALDPPHLYGEVRAQAAVGERERASWMCFLTAYLSPTEDEDAFASIRTVLAAAPDPVSLPPDLGELLDSVALGPRSSHERGRGAQALDAYRQWVARSGGPQGAQSLAFTGDPDWSAERRFARVFERLALPGLERAARYELLLLLGRLGVYELGADSLHLSSGRSTGAEDAATLAAKRIFGIADPLLLDRRAGALAQAAGAPLESLDLALANWASPVRATLGFDAAARLADAADAAGALGL